jgi:hypothetical protein
MLSPSPISFFVVPIFILRIQKVQWLPSYTSPTEHPIPPHPTYFLYISSETPTLSLMWQTRAASLIRLPTRLHTPPRRRNPSTINPIHIIEITNQKPTNQARKIAYKLYLKRTNLREKKPKLVISNIHFHPKLKNQMRKLCSHESTRKPPDQCCCDLFCSIRVPWR